MLTCGLCTAIHTLAATWWSRAWTTLTRALSSRLSSEPERSLTEKGNRKHRGTRWCQPPLCCRLSALPCTNGWLDHGLTAASFGHLGNPILLMELCYEMLGLLLPSLPCCPACDLGLWSEWQAPETRELEKEWRRDLHQDRSPENAGAEKRRKQ